MSIIHLVEENEKADEPLERCKGQLKEVLILGWDEEGNFVSDTNIERSGEVLLLLKMCENRLMDRILQRQNNLDDNEPPL